MKLNVSDKGLNIRRRQDKISDFSEQSEGSGLEVNKKTIFLFMYNSPDNVYSDDLTTPKRTK